MGWLVVEGLFASSENDVVVFYISIKKVEIDNVFFGLRRGMFIY